MAKALALVRPVEIPPMIGTVRPAPKLECASPNSACAKTELLFSSYSWAKQIIGKVLVGERRSPQDRKRKWGKAGTAYIGCDTEVAVEIERILSFPAIKAVAAIAQIGISAEHCRPCSVLAPGCHGSAALGDER
jgi:hypothetical protein